MTIAWVIGSGGLLGSAIERALVSEGTMVYVPAEPFRWDQAPVLAAQLRENVRRFAQKAQGSVDWAIYWAAGVGTMGSVPSQLVGETAALTVLLAELGAQSMLQAKLGAIAFASSAGAIYAGSRDEIVTENTHPAPTTAYAVEKLRQEEALSHFAETSPNLRALIARISTLYGTSRQTGKRQGLLTYIARAVIRKEPVNIYVPFDTIRDYIHADDAASMLIEALKAIRHQVGLEVKVIASERPVTVAEIIATFRRVSRTNPRIVTSISRETSLYSRKIQFRSIIVANRPPSQCRSLMVGIAELLAAERAAFARANHAR